jgi:hypothetical protein
VPPQSPSAQKPVAPSASGASGSAATQKSEPKRVAVLKDGSELVGEIKQSTKECTVKTGFGMFILDADEVVAVREIPTAKVASSTISNGDTCVIVSKDGKKLLGKVKIEADGYLVTNDAGTTAVAKEDVASIERVEAAASQQSAGSGRGASANPDAQGLADGVADRLVSLNDGSKLVGKILVTNEGFAITFHSRIIRVTKDQVVSIAKQERGSPARAMQPGATKSQACP